MSLAPACFNNECREAKSQTRRKGWRLRNGDHALLCDCCASAFEEGKFCDTFHQHLAGWRSCESCGKRVHCGCIGAAHTFVLLDAGGVNCIDCAIRTSISTQNQECRPPPCATVSLADLHKLSQSLNIGFIHEDKHSLCMRNGIPVMFEDQSPVSHYGVASASFSETENQSRASITQQLSTLLTGNPLSATLNVGLHSSGKTLRDSKIVTDMSTQNQVYSWYCPEMSDKKLELISGDSNSVITPLFEKMLSASDTSRIGRLVLPKKCAETYFPPISEPEGLPLRIKNVKGQEWTLQYRFWPNNNSRMYVLEGITPCIQSMELQAGDIVTFSRLEREGKLIMGYRKAASIHTRHQVDKVYPVGLQSKVHKSGYAVKEAIVEKSSVCKRRNSIVGSTIKRMKLDAVSLELSVTLKEAHGLLRPHIDHVPNVVLVEDFEFEEYKEAPVIGRPTIITKASLGHCAEDVRWAQCDSCLKWRRIPPCILPPSGWTCSHNSWDPQRSSCTAAQELNNGQLQDKLNTMNSANCKKNTAEDSNALSAATESLTKSSIRSSMPKEDLSTEQLERVISGSNSDPAGLGQATSKHPRHKPGCSCIVCSQPPSGKGPKHKSTCTCNVCASVRRRFRTMMMRRDKKKSDKEAQALQPTESSRSSDKAEPEQPESSSRSSMPKEDLSTKRLEPCSNSGLHETGSVNKLNSSPSKGHFDLNIQPEREEHYPSANPGM